jgi:hypothetical protein
VTNCFVAITAGGVIAGYYTLASASIPPGELAAELARHLLRYPTVPPRGSAALPSTYDFLGKVSAGFSSGMRRHERRADQAYFTLLVDAEDDSAVEFYRHYGFIPFTTAPRVVFLPLATAAKVLARNP